jgi:hypothetical protein
MGQTPHQDLFRLLSDPKNRVTICFRFRDPYDVLVGVSGETWAFECAVEETDLDPILDLLESVGNPDVKVLRESLLDQLAVYLTVRTACQEFKGQVFTNDTLDLLQVRIGEELCRRVPEAYLLARHRETLQKLELRFDEATHTLVVRSKK